MLIRPLKNVMAFLGVMTMQGDDDCIMIASDCMLIASA